MLVAAAESLGHQSGRRGAQKIEADENQVEEHGADRKPGEDVGRAEAARDGGIRQPEQRRRQEAERHRNGDREHEAVGHLERAGAIEFGLGCRAQGRHSIRRRGTGSTQLESTIAQ